MHSLPLKGGDSMCLHPQMIVNLNGDPVIVSCRKCTECMQVRANEWGVRCHHELMEHNQNCFITLTYENSPIRLHKEHLQNFIKRLRKHISPLKIKYFSCGEYGDQELRPHYHIIIFGYDFIDKYFWKLSNSGKPMYRSNTLESLWTYGNSITQDANKQTAMYSAKYAMKINDDLPDFLKHWPEFNTMSKNLGIDGIMKNIQTYLLTNEIYIDGFGYNIPRICLEKYCDDNGFADEEKKKFFNEIYDKTKIRTATEFNIYRRLDKKKKLHQGLRKL